VIKLSLLIAVLLILLAALPAQAQGPRWYWTGTFDVRWEQVPGQYYGSWVTYCVYTNGWYRQLVPVQPGWGGRLYCSPTLY
jgi:hypothetical protein